MANKRKRTCWELCIEWELYGERDYIVELFSSLRKAQEKLSEELANDLINNGGRFETFEYEDENSETKPLPYSAINGDVLNTKYVNLYSVNGCDFITYMIRKQVIQ